MTVREWIGVCLIGAGVLWPTFLLMWWRRKRYEGVQILRLEPGDMLMFSCRKTLSRESANHLSDQLREVFPDHKTVLAQDMDVSVIRKPDATP